MVLASTAVACHVSTIIMLIMPISTILLVLANPFFLFFDQHSVIKKFISGPALPLVSVWEGLRGANLQSDVVEVLEYR
jgi:hypothetical protein